MGGSNKMVEETLKLTYGDDSNLIKDKYETLCIRENPGCIFIATNHDATGNMTETQECRPGVGCMVAAVCGSTDKEPIVVGKAINLFDGLLTEEMTTSNSVSEQSLMMLGSLQSRTIKLPLR
ncbi:hypothetical protein L6452_30251 [Arctium lappa]|uniref:Uncharacterized protein n=1 Tax=Arctium lappa TaxID=4217 RepID=A0ACB8ZIZ4_ARCLA|nr:hypothetical protein L6452_30251 [Arctium lappa]